MRRIEPWMGSSGPADRIDDAVTLPAASGSVDASPPWRATCGSTIASVAGFVAVSTFPSRVNEVGATATSLQFSSTRKHAEESASLRGRRS